jgi:D-alanyl-D-alanine carboxypeptidase/D-alanyl-D-alanine-endopeptidase (penicillin-binding protein 4)
MRLTRKLLAFALVFGFSVQPHSASAFEPAAATSVFARLVKAPDLRNPSVSLIDASSGEVIFENSAYSLRKPASVLKVLSATATLKYLEGDQTFQTVAYLGTETSSVVITGALDPWIAYRYTDARKMKRTSLPRLALASIDRINRDRIIPTRNIKVYYSNLYTSDLLSLTSIFKSRGIRMVPIKILPKEGPALSVEEIFSSSSPTVNKMLSYFLTWSDNSLADRMAQLASQSAGNGRNEAGVAKTFSSILREMEIDPSKIRIKDGSGLSHDNRVTSHLVAQLLYKIHKDPEFSAIIDGLPISGVTGTLEKRYIESAPEAIGLVRAKTGTLNGTVSLAGYIESEDREYIFVVIADNISRSFSASERARTTLDKYLAKLATPLIALPVIEPVEVTANESESSTTLVD